MREEYSHPNLLPILVGSSSQFALNWRTPKEAGGQCMLFTIRFDDGRSVRAGFRLR